MLNSSYAKTLIAALSMIAAPHASADHHGGSVPATGHQKEVLELNAETSDPDTVGTRRGDPVSPHQQEVLESRRSAAGMPVTEHQKQVIDGKVKDGVRAADGSDHGTSPSPHQKAVMEKQPMPVPGSMGEKAGIVDTQRMAPTAEPGGAQATPSMGEMAGETPQSGDRGQASETHSNSTGSRAGEVKQN